MRTVETSARRATALPWLLLLYCGTSLLHFAHNAEFLADYPNLPPWLSPSWIYLVWCGITAVGVVGYLLYRRGHETVGIAVLSAYAVAGFDGLLHYGRAPFHTHTSMMNFTIWAEVASAALLLMLLIGMARRIAP